MGREPVRLPALPTTTVLPEVPRGMMPAKPCSGLYFSFLHLFHGGASYVLSSFHGLCLRSVLLGEIRTREAPPAHRAQRVLRAQCLLLQTPSRGVFGSLLEHSSPQTWTDFFFSASRHFFHFHSPFQFSFLATELERRNVECFLTVAMTMTSRDHCHYLLNLSWFPCATAWTLLLVEKT